MARLISYAAEDDRIGPIMRTPEYNFVAGETHELDVPIPGPEFIAKRVCTCLLYTSPSPRD